MLKELHENKRMTILVSSHDLNNITEVCTRILLMENGRIIKDIQTSSGTLDELEAYFRV
jgi:ABC-2 type transport system ATP-binding protein